MSKYRNFSINARQRAEQAAKERRERKPVEFPITRTVWYVGYKDTGERVWSQGNSMHDPSEPSPDYETKEEALIYVETEYLDVFRCEKIIYREDD